MAGMGEKTDKITPSPRRYNDYHERRSGATATLKPGQWVYVYHPRLAVTAADQLVTDLYSKIFSRKLGQYCVLSSETETVRIDEKVIQNTISSDRALIAPKSEIRSSVTNPYASPQLLYSVGLFEDVSTTDLLMDTSAAQRWTAPDST